MWGHILAPGERGDETEIAFVIVSPNKLQFSYHDVINSNIK